MKRLLLPALLTLLCGAPVACYAQIVSMPEPLTANSPVPDAPSGKTPNGSSVSGKGGREALKAAMLDDIARKNLQFLDNPPGGIDMFKIDNGRKPESALFVHNVYLDG